MNDMIQTRVHVLLIDEFPPHMNYTPLYYFGLGKFGADKILIFSSNSRGSAEAIARAARGFLPHSEVVIEKKEHNYYNLFFQMLHWIDQMPKASFYVNLTGVPMEWALAIRDALAFREAACIPYIINCQYEESGMELVAHAEKDDPIRLIPMLGIYHGGRWDEVAPRLEQILSIILNSSQLYQSASELANKLNEKFPESWKQGNSGIKLATKYLRILQKMRVIRIERGFHNRMILRLV